MPLSVPVPASETAAAVWAYVTRLLTNLDNIRAARIDEITAARMAELDPANMPGDIAAILADTAAMDARLPAAPATEGKQDTILTRIGDPTGQTLASLVAKLGNPATALGAILENAELPLKFPSAEVLDDIAAVGPTNTTERTITVSLPAAATIRRVILAAFITIMNDSANAQKIDIDVEGRLGAGGWNTYFSQDDVVGFPGVDGATTGLVALSDVTALVTAAGTYGFRLAVTQTSANSIRYTVQHVLIITYRMS